MTKETFRNSDFFSLVLLQLRESGRVRIKVKGSSMFPFLRDGRDEVLLQCLKNKPLRRGRVYLFRHRGECVLHRLIRLSPERLTFRGDNVFSGVEVCSREDVLAVAVRIFRERKSGHFRSLSPNSICVRAAVSIYRLLHCTVHFVRSL